MRVSWDVHGSREVAWVSPRRLGLCASKYRASRAVGVHPGGPPRPPFLASSGTVVQACLAADAWAG